VHIPTSYLSGFFIEDAPIESVPVEQTEKLRQAILVAVERGNPPISQEDANTRVGRKDHPLLQIAGVRSWYVLDRQTTGLWSVMDANGIYEIRVDRPMMSRGWHEDKSRRVQFPAGTSPMTRFPTSLR